MPSAAVLIIGDEILSGKFRDENSPWLATRLRSIGVDLKRVLTIPDDIDVIARSVAELSAAFDHVFTTGGVGPTHDDLTMAGVSRAFGVRLVRHPTLEALLRGHLGDRANDAALRMAEVPEGAVLWEGPGLRFPQVVMRNVLIFPGVPALLRLKFDAVAHRFSGRVVLGERLHTTAAESDIADLLTEAQDRFPDVAIGSYPKFDSKPYTVTLTLDSREPGPLAACLAWLRARLPEQIPAPFDQSAI